MIFENGTWVKAINSGGLRFVTKQTNEYCFLDDGKVSGQSPSPHCYYKNYKFVYRWEIQLSSKL